MPGKTILVSSAAQLVKTARSAVGGDTILLAPGNYGDVSLANLRPTSTVTIKSANPDADASFKTLRITNASNLTIEDVDVNNPIAAGAPRSAATAINKSTNINFVGVDIAGSNNGNAADDAHGLIITASDNVAVLDGTFSHLHAAIVVGLTSDVIIAGNTITQSREGVNIGQVTGGLFERNLVTDMAALPGDHPDAFQVHNGTRGAIGSSDLAFRSNVIFQGSGTSVQGIYIHSEQDALGIHHSNISIENNFYVGSARHAISISNADDVVVRGNTVLYSGSGGLVPAILSADVQGGIFEDNISTLLLPTRNTGSTNVIWRDNIDVWDPKFKVGVAQDSLFAPGVGTTLDLARLSPLAGSAAAGAGFHTADEIGNLSGSVAVQLAHYVPMFEAEHFATAMIA